MKTTRIICLVIAWLWIVLICMSAIANISDLPLDNIAFIIGTLIGSVLFLIPSFILFFIAKKIRKKIDKKKREALINSFENI